MKKTHNYKYTNFTRSNVRDLNSEKGLYMYKVIALPLSFSNIGQQKEVTKKFVEWFSNFYIRKWDNKKSLSVSFDKEELKVKIPKTKIESIENSTFLSEIEEGFLFRIFEQMVSFFPPLYVGITNDISTRFLSHTQDSNDNSLINKINKHPEIKDNEVLFIWQDLDVEFVERYLEISSEDARNTLLEDLETLFIQLNNPIFNISKRS